MSYRVIFLFILLTVFVPVLTIAFGAQFPAAQTLILREKDPWLQSSLEQVLSRYPFKKLVVQDQLCVALVDLSDPELIRYAGVHDDRMRYAASLPKIAILLAAFDQINRGNLKHTPELKGRMEQMIRYSCNRAATRLIEQVGFETIARTLTDSRYELYDPKQNGGLWVGKDYGGGPGRWRGDPLHNISHGATARQVSRFLVMLDKGMLVNTWASQEMKEILARSGIHHKFVKGLAKRPESIIYRKSGTWRKFHSDSVLVERNGKKYVAVALMVNHSSKEVLSRLIIQLDDIIHKNSKFQLAKWRLGHGIEKGRASE
ncbi:class A beta-lactamase-related serine hydrolase [Acidobacteria bacterium AH-259-O06]|nr:class A beta-lactamase-related serine hydrolase [Acidobacteria bacterium AH-259-O06]